MVASMEIKIFYGKQISIADIAAYVRNNLKSLIWQTSYNIDDDNDVMEFAIENMEFLYKIFTRFLEF